MKKTLILAAAMALLVSCGKGGGIPERKDIVLTRAEAEVLNAGNGFSFGLLREVASENGCRNVLISPLSAHIATCMLANGAGGETYSQIVNTLGYEGFGIGDVNSAYKTLVHGLKEVDTSTELRIANSLWIKDGFPVSGDYAGTMSKDYGANVQNLDLSSSAAVKAINDWCSGKTGKMIPQAIDRIDDETVMLLVNAIYFKGKWKERFESKNTSKEDFKPLGGQKSPKDFMHITKRFTYAETSDGKVRMCELPYGNGAFVMDIVLPDEDVDFEGFIAGMTGEKWGSMFTYRETHKVELSLPKFKVEADYELSDALKALGMVLPYDQDKADFLKMCSNPADWQLWLGRTTQKSIIEVDENGSKAASVTTHRVSGDATAPPPESTVVFKADHPFLYLIRETTSGTILFMGTLTD